MSATSEPEHQLGDEAGFSSLFERHRRELQVHCYRMLGSFTESEDMVQETFARAWKRRDSFEGRSSVRAWLYQIATNACLDQLRVRKRRRVLPFDVMPPIGPDNPSPAPPGAFDWIEPFPDQLLETGPDEEVVTRESIELAFLAAIQHLTPIQRATMILRDVLGWSTKDTARVLETSEAAVRSALQRARPALRKNLRPSREEWVTPAVVSEEERAVLRGYIDAMERDDVHALAEVLADDVKVSYPQIGIWVDTAEGFIEGSKEFAPPGEYRFVATTANLQPAVAIYLKPPDATAFHLTALEVLRVEGGRIVEIVDYDLPELYPAFGLSTSL